MNIVQYPHPSLRYQARPVTRVDDALRAAASRMLGLMYEAKGVGLAATQVALPWRMFVYNPTADPSKPELERVILNPVILEKKGSLDESEGCLSFPGLYQKVRRAKAVKVRYHTLEGSMEELEVADFVSRIFQHETDHLSGILFVDKLGPIGRLSVRPALARMEAEFREAQSRGEIAPDAELVRRIDEIASGGAVSP
ncbi:MAG: peptide deformylase [Planctomycetota bacterium]|jgi:peptide deformylase